MLDVCKVGSLFCATNSIPAVNFGVQLEISYASGNYRPQVALALEKHTKR